MSTPASAQPIIEARKLEKFYAQPDGTRIQVISPTDLAVYPGQIIALLGQSGCGKSTLQVGLDPILVWPASLSLWCRWWLRFLRPLCFR